MTSAIRQLNESNKPQHQGCLRILSGCLGEEGVGAGMSEQVFETCSIISGGTISTAGCLDLPKYAHGSDNEREREAGALDPAVKRDPRCSDVFLLLTVKNVRSLFS